MEMMQISTDEGHKMGLKAPEDFKGLKKELTTSCDMKL